MTGTLPTQFKDSDLSPLTRPNALGRFGKYGGQYVPETLIPALIELEQAAKEAWKDSSFNSELNHLLKTYVGRSTPLYEATRLTEHYRKNTLKGPRIWLKREDLNHTGAHKINNALGQALLAIRMGKKELLLKLELVSMELQLRQSALVLDWNALSIWAKKICEDKP